jgi:hypothetical protein
MTPEEALRSILRLIDGSDDVEDVQVLHILLQTIKARQRRGWDVRRDATNLRATALRDGMPLCLANVRGQSQRAGQHN